MTATEVVGANKVHGKNRSLVHNNCSGCLVGSETMKFVQLFISNVF